jgi:hypothetical protein
LSVRRACALALTTTLSTTAAAQVSAQEKAVADAFFNDGVKLMRAGNFEAACPKLAESERIDPAVGTALYLGDCFERLGKIASAQAMLQEAYDYARRRGDGRAQIAKDHHDRLTPSTLAIIVDRAARVPGLVVLRDDVEVSIVMLGAALPADGGAHVVVATAPHKKKFTATVVVPLKDGTVAVAIPKLEDEPLVPAAYNQQPITVTPPTSNGSSRRTIGLVTGIVGIGGIVLGSTAGIVATLDWNASNSSDNQCNPNTTTCLTQHGIDLRASAQSWATVSTVGFIAGGVILGAGIILLITAPRATRSLGWTTTGVALRF